MHRKAPAGLMIACCVQIHIKFRYHSGSDVIKLDVLFLKIRDYMSVCNDIISLAGAFGNLAPMIGKPFLKIRYKISIGNFIKLGCPEL